MLYSPQWEVKADPLSLASLIAWLEKQPPQKEYEYANLAGGCLLGQYMAHIGEPWSLERYHHVANKICHGYKDCVFYIGVGNPRTFGAALARAREVQVRQ